MHTHICIYTAKVLGLYILLAGELVCLQARRKVSRDFRLSGLQSVSISIVVRGRKLVQLEK